METTKALNGKLRAGNPRVCICIAVFMACAVHSLFAVGKGADTKGEYWEDASGVKHYYLFQRAGSGKQYDFGHNVYSREESRNTEAAVVKWVAGSIYTLERDATYALRIAQHPNTTMYGIELETLNNTAAPHAFVMEYPRCITIGGYGIHSVAGNTLQMYYAGTGEKIHLAESQTWSGPAAETLSSAPFVIVPNYIYDNTYKGYVGAEDDAVLTLEGDLVVPWIVYDHPLTNMDVVIKAPAILSLPKGSYGLGNLYARNVTIDGGCGIKFGVDKSFVPVSGSSDRGGAGTYGIGSYPLISPVHVAETIVLANGATLTALDTTTVSGGVTVVSSGTVANAFSGTFNLTAGETVLRIPSGSTLDLTGATFTGDGALKVDGSGTLILDGSINDPSGRFYLSDAALAGFEGDFVVSGGTLVLEHASSIPSGKTVTTSGDGALLLIDATGFNAETQMGGTKALAEPSRLVVTDADVTGAVTVNNGETLLVYGNGLGENASLTLKGGATVMFLRSATVSAPTWYTNTVYYKTFDASVTGTVASVITLSDTPESDALSARLQIDSPGLVNFSGSGQFDEFRMNTGNAAITGEYRVYGAQAFYGGHMTVRDGGSIRVSKSWQYLRLHDNSSRDACLEIAAGGTYEIAAGDCRTYVGRNDTAYESKLLLTGGTYIHKKDWLYLNSKGVIEVRAGLFQTGRRITCNASAGSAKVLLKGGEFYVQGDSNYAFALFDGEGPCTVEVDGNATLRHSGIAVMRDSTNETPNITWTCTEGARLKVVGRDNSDDSTLVLHNFEADGLIFDFNTSDYNAYREVVRIIDPKDPIGIGFVLPGKTGSKIVASNAVPALVASYVVPAGQTLDAAALPSDWYEGFGAVSVSNIIFETGSTFRFPFFGTAAPLAISGLLTLPDAMNYSVIQTGQKATVAEVPVITPALGTVEAEGGSAFTCTGGVPSSAATLSVANGGLAFSYKVTGGMFLIR